VGGSTHPLSAEDIHYGYSRGRPVLLGAGFTAPRGMLTCILGPNGAGKTTLLRVLLRLVEPWRGRVLVFGEDWGRMPRRRLARLMGYVPQSTSTVFSYRVIDYIVMGRTPYHGVLGLPGRADYEAARRAAELLGIEGLLDKELAELSGGQERLVVIARALAQEPRILVLDEPTAHLDVANRLRVMETVKRLLGEGVVEAAVATMHDPTTACLYCDHVAVLHAGRVVCEGGPGEVLTPGVLGRVYGVVFRSVSIDGSRVVVPVGLEG